MILNELEKAVLQALGTANPQLSKAHADQLENVVVIDRKNTGVGFFTTLQPQRLETHITGPRVLGSVFAKIQGMQNPMTFVLLLKNGIVDTLEGASIEEAISDIDFSKARFQMVTSTFHH